MERIAQERDDPVDRLPGLRHVATGAVRIAFGASVAKHDLGGAHEERATERGVSRALRLVHVAVEQLTPLRALRVRALEGIRSVGVPRIDRHQALEGRPRPDVAHQLFVEDARELHEEPPFPRGAARGEELDLEQLLDGLVLPTPLVHPTRRLEERRELVRSHARIALDLRTQLLPRGGAIGIVLQQP